MSADPVPSSRDAARLRLVEVATQLLAEGGPAAVTTRSVAVAAGVQPPAIYRLFGDKNGLLEAVADHGFTTYLCQKRPVDVYDDPVADLRAGWELHIGFGLAHPAVFRLMHTASPTVEGRRMAASGADVLAQRVHRIAEAGRLRMPEASAVELIHAAGTGVVLTLISRPAGSCDTPLADLAWESVSAAILTDERDAAPAGAVAAAVALAAALPTLEVLTDNERALLGDWLRRVAASGRVAQDNG